MARQGLTSRGVTLRDYTIVIDGKPDETEDSAKTKAGMFARGDSYCIAVGMKDGKAYPITDAPEDIAGANGLQAWLDAGENPDENSNLWVLRAVLEAGITEVNGCKVAPIIAEMEANAAQEREDNEKPTCQCSAAMTYTALGTTVNMLTKLGERALITGDSETAFEYALAIGIIEPLAEKAKAYYEGIELSGDVIHDLYHTLGIYCPDLDGWKEGEPSESRKQNKMHA